VHDSALSDTTYLSRAGAPGVVKYTTDLLGSDGLPSYTDWSAQMDFS